MSARPPHAEEIVAERMAIPPFELSKVAALLQVAESAIEADAASRGAASAKADLFSAYRDWKASKGIDRVERDTPDWLEMMHDTRLAYGAVVNAKRREYNARRRLRNAIKRVAA